MNQQLDSGTKHLMRLMLRDKQPDGWTPVSAMVWPLIEKIPPELVEIHADKAKARLTEEGETIIAWL